MIDLAKNLKRTQAVKFMSKNFLMKLFKFLNTVLGFTSWYKLFIFTIFVIFYEIVRDGTVRVGTIKKIGFGQKSRSFVSTPYICFNLRHFISSTGGPLFCVPLSSNVPDILYDFRVLKLKNKGLHCGRSSSRKEC